MLGLPERIYILVLGVSPTRESPTRRPPARQPADYVILHPLAGFTWSDSNGGVPEQAQNLYSISIKQEKSSDFGEDIQIIEKI